MKNLFLYSCALFTLISFAQVPPPTAASLAKAIQVQGTRSVMRSLVRDDSFHRVIDEISSGNTEWIQLAPKLAKGTDAGNSEALIIALAQALPKNPKAVLAALGPIASADQVCGVPFIEPTPPEIANYLAQTIPVVKGLQESGYSLLAGECLTNLLQIKKK